MSEPEQNINHIAIIMDGNGRWAKSKNLPRIVGHKEGAKRIKDVVETSKILGVKYLTLYAFSSENWNRPKTEVNALMNLLVSSIKNYKKNFIKNKIRFLTIGDISKLPEKCITAIQDLKNSTQNFKDSNLILALNYGSRDEIVRAVNKIISDGINNVSWEILENYLDTKDIPNPDLVIRTSGEKRLSNYLMLQTAYSEFYFTDVLWPDFDGNQLKKAIQDFSSRERRYGLTGEQLKK